MSQNKKKLISNRNNMLDCLVCVRACVHVYKVKNMFELKIYLFKGSFLRLKNA